jgi:hypothetical protein
VQRYCCPRSWPPPDLAVPSKRAAPARGKRRATYALLQGRITMSRSDHAKAIKAYIAAKWRRPDNGLEIEDAASRLPGPLRERVDNLGVEDARLLRVPDDKLFVALDRLESSLAI